MKRLFAIAACVVLVVSACGSGSESHVTVAAGTTLVDSGFIEAVVDRYIQESPDVAFSVLASSSAEAIALADAGNVQVIITHEPEMLASYRSRTPHAATVEPFSSDFVLVGPPGVVTGANDIGEAFSEIAAVGIPFVSRDDRSGTHKREMQIWESIGIDPTSEPWYVRSGAGMGAVLLIADQREAMTLAERGAYIAAEESIALRPVELANASGLDNPYSVTVVFPAEMPAAAAFSAWLTSDAGRAAIADVNAELFGLDVYRVP